MPFNREQFSQLVQSFLKHDVDPETARDIQAEVQRRMQEEPPIRIALIGLTGVGKSSTINALFHAGAPISHTRACTQEADEYETDVKEFSTTAGRHVDVFDMPGLGEDMDADKIHIQAYLRVLPDVDVALWIHSAINRAITPVQEFLDNYSHLTPNMVFGMNKVDVVPPGAEFWDHALNLPSLEQEQNIQGRADDVRSKLRTHGWNGEVVAYSAEKRYQLPQLLHELLLAVNAKRRWVLEATAEVADFEDLVDKTKLEQARALAGV